MMSETAKVRLVRCPKCENLLPEVTDYSVYQCGGCGAVLEAKSKGVDLDTFSQKSDDEERNENTVEKLSDRFEKIMNGSEKRVMEMSDGSEGDVRSSISPSNRSERRVVRDRAHNNRASLRNKDERWDSESDVIQDKSSVERAKNAQDFENLAMYNARNEKKSEMEGFGRAQRIDADVTGYTKEGPSNLAARSNYAYENADYVGEDRAELLKKLDELTTQLSRSGNLVDKGKEKVPLDRRMAHPDPYDLENSFSYPDALLEVDRPQFRRPSYHNQYSEPPPLMHRQEMGPSGFYPQHYANVQGYTDPSRSHMLRRGPQQPPVPYQISPSHAYMSGPYLDDGMVHMDTLEPYPSNFNRHHSSCPCYQCLNMRQVPPHVLPTSYNDKYANVTNDKMFHYRDNSGSSFGTRDYNNHGIHDLRPLRSHNAQSHARWPTDVTSEVDAVIRRRPARVHLPSGGQYCRPIAGGAPFLTCYNCFELLLLPKKVLTKNNKKKVRCRACSTVIIFVVSHKNLVISMATNTPVKVDNNNDVHPSQARTTFSSDDYDKSSYDFHSIERANNSTEMKSRHSTSSYTSEAEEDRENLRGPRKHPGPADTSTKDKVHPPPAGSSLQDYFEHSNKYHLANRLVEGNKSGRSENGKPLPENITPRRKESSATEIDISSNEYANTGTTFDSGEGSKEGDNLKGSRAESFYAGIRGKIFKEFDDEKANVTVNGHLIPDRLIKKAEKLAGPIKPGNYWYDFRAGFWGALGGPCLGIIPPFIEEFNYPMPDHCAGGNTLVYVNGRELNQKDLKLLGSRGLPTERDRSYIVEISGRVLDEDTGEELDSLGKLAPTLMLQQSVLGLKIKIMKQFNNNVHRNPFSSVLVKFGVCFLLLGLAYRLFSSSFVNFSPVVVVTDGEPPLTVAPPPPKISRDPLVNLFKYTSENGDWVEDPNGPMYTNTTCHTIEPPQNCMRNGRPDSDYVYWRWNPRDCNLPKFDPKRFLETMRDKSLAFIGDSIMRNHVQSLLCVLSQAEQPVLVYHDEAYKNRRWSFPSYQFNVSVAWAPFIAKSVTFEDDNGVSTGLIQLHLDKLDAVWTKQYNNFDYIVIAGGKWFLKSAIYYENNKIVGCHNCYNKNITQLGFVYAYRKALNSTLKFITKSKHKPYVFFRTTTPDHFENGEWDTGGYCNRTRPFKVGDVEIAYIDEMLRNVELEEFESAKKVGYENGVSLKLFDTTLLSLLRPDGHPGVYRQYNPYAGKDKHAKIQNDCLHWCLPGPIDSWNDLMMEMLTRSSRR
ncbi:hypothetical protein BUALT_Bualt01G0237300 [Buddleja alternifolia]|uniref:Uncharacterized protein n=1 Tax=Buddleja alternifolia TaxID=168488 RepID=A0AAV6YI02_9LAMI|nr:hypothetical protein BUALT_Bualt01G0237300 [Buddleja alternifolia]